MSDEYDAEDAAEAVEGAAIAAIYGGTVYHQCNRCGEVTGNYANMVPVCGGCLVRQEPSDDVSPYDGPTRPVTCPDCSTQAEAPTVVDRAQCGECGTNYILPSP